MNNTKKHHRDLPPVVTQLKLARKFMVAFVIGALIGGFIPIAVFTLTNHVLAVHEYNPVEAWNAGLKSQMLLILIAGGLVFSIKSVYSWARSAFGGDWLKSLGYVLLVEGILVLSPLIWLKIAAAIYLVAINAVTAGAHIAIDGQRVEDEESDDEEVVSEHLDGLSPPLEMVEPKKLKPSYDLDTSDEATLRPDADRENPVEETEQLNAEMAEVEELLRNEEPFAVETEEVVAAKKPKRQRVKKSPSLSQGAIQEIKGLADQGMKPKQIAQAVNIPVQTARHYSSNHNRKR